MGVWVYAPGTFLKYDLLDYVVHFGDTTAIHQLELKWWPLVYSE